MTIAPAFLAAAARATRPAGAPASAPQAPAPPPLGDGHTAPPEPPARAAKVLAWMALEPAGSWARWRHYREYLPPAKPRGGPTYAPEWCDPARW